jgi:hypothetical protein
VITVIGPFSWAATASSVLPASRNSVEPRGCARRPADPGAAWSGEQGVSSLARHRRDVKRDGAAVAFLQDALFFQLAQIPANGIGRHLQRFNQFADAQLTGFTQPVEDVFLSGELMHGKRLRKLTQ